MDGDVLVKIGYAAIAAAFGYVATFAFKRYEILRDIALEVDQQLRGALDAAETHTERGGDVLDDVQRALKAARLRSVSLPARQKGRVVDQLGVADEVLSLLYLHLGADGMMPTMFTHYIQAAVTAVREEVANLLLPPPFLYRRRARPQSFPQRDSFDAIMASYKDGLAGLDEALEPYRVTTLATAD